MDKKNNYKLGIIGCGNMAKAILRGVFSSGFLDFGEIYAYEIKAEIIKSIKDDFKINISENARDLVEKSRYILISVKPRDVSRLLTDIKEFFDPGFNTLISIAAGVTTDFLEKKLSAGASVIRVMPNTPALVNCGIAVLSKGKKVARADLDFATGIFTSLGECIIVDEKLQNAATAISGSGPAYFFLFYKFLVDAAIKKGISSDIAQRLVLNTIQGSAEMLKEFDCDADRLIKMVASPGGTTEAALNIFTKKQLDNIINEAVSSALKRSLEIQDEIESSTS